jgi:pimeloyl-ACP methyl ester carboxylesterase
VALDERFVAVGTKKVHVVEMRPDAPLRPPTEALAPSAHDMPSAGAQALVMLHGLFSNLSLYFFRIAPSLAHTYRVVIYDLRSHGLSERASGAHTLEVLSEDLLALMDALEIEKAALAGHSYGGTVALLTALQHPEKVSQLALIDAPCLTEPRFAAARLRQRLSHGRVTDRSVARYASAAGLSAQARRSPKSQEQIRYLLTEGRLEASFSAGRTTMQSLDLGRLAMPTLLLYGTRSPFRATGRRLKAAIPCSVLELVEGGHDFPVKSAPQLTEHLACFLAGTGI